MVKCVVSGCPNRVRNLHGTMNRPKTFFSFPTDPTRVKVWLAALRETDKLDSTEHHLICEDHFLPNDITTDGVKSDAIPIMSPYLDGSMGMISSWEADPQEEEDQWEEGDDDGEDEEDEFEGGYDAPAFAKPSAPELSTPQLPAPELPTLQLPAPEPPTLQLPAPEPPTLQLPAPEPPTLQLPAPEPPASELPAPQHPTLQLPAPAVAPPPKLDPPPAIRAPVKDPDTKETPGTKSPGLKQQVKRVRRERPVSGVPVALRFLELLQSLPGSMLDIRKVCTMLQTCKRRISDISSVLEGVNLVEKMRNRVRWIGGSDCSSPLALLTLRTEIEDLKVMEEKLNSLIKTCSQQLFDMTDDREDAALAYVTLQDISSLEAFREQTLMVVKAPDETTLKVPAPSEDWIQVHLKSGSGPVTVLTCDPGSEDGAAAERSGCFLPLEESQINTSALHGDLS
ncbi:transcription factor E2F3 isoform X3 [Notolabrus celidotus]|uniref:transcription factor E2F3 isoform X3 n=1 Tax=Notolabrus celidotus TaxID=1203425 RepID=UPI0014903019|nr:transcription factor E2F3 isoform X3 [Notolabrus celidotus]XP_034534485.1 transcription factor E2F3 isoform X3 [Notolabrus celidotus]